MDPRQARRKKVRVPDFSRADYALPDFSKVDYGVPDISKLNFTKGPQGQKIVELVSGKVEGRYIPNVATPPDFNTGQWFVSGEVPPNASGFLLDDNHFIPHGEATAYYDVGLGKTRPNG